MTEREFLELEPRERDAIVCGCFESKPVGEPTFYDSLQRNGWWRAKITGSKASEFGSVMVIEWLPLPVTQSIAAAWTVVEKMEADVDPKRRTLQLVRYPYRRAYATFGHPEGDHEGWSEANGDHCEPLAICLAALRALGEIE